MAGSRVAAYAVDTATVALSIAYAKMTLDGDDETDAVDFPSEVVLGLATLYLDTIVTAVSVTWYVSEDAAGDKPISPPKTTTIVGQTAATGGVAESLDIPWKVVEVAGTMYIWAKLDAGTANCKKAKLSFNTPASR
jgi:hypothetical protein